MKIDTNPAIKKALVTILFYVIAGIVIFFLNEASPSGPCTPGLGILAFLLLPVISATRLVVNFLKLLQGVKASKISAFIHLTFIVGFIACLKFA